MLKNKIILLVTFCACNLGAVSQDYQSFISNDIHYFQENSTGYILASEIPSTAVDGGDSIFFPFRSLRFLDDGLLHDAPGWMGEKIIIKEDGINLFFNSDLDTILINTKANLGESFILYNYESGNAIEATVTSITEETILGITDSVKIFQITSDEPGFLFNMNEFRLGKTSGLIDLYPFYNFPNNYGPFEAEEYRLVGKLYPKTGITKPTFSEVNNLEIGDFVNHQTNLSTDDFGYTDTRRDKILLKNYFDPDSVKYDIERYWKHHYSGTSEVDPAYTTYNLDTLINSYNVSDEFILNFLIPEKNYGGGSTDMTFTLTYEPDCGYNEIRQTYGTSPILVDGEIAFGYFELPQQTWSFQSFSLNEGYHTYVDEPTTNNSKKLTAYKHADVICGNGFFLNLEEVEKITPFSIYPNPTSDNINIEHDQSFKYKIYNLEGKILLTGNAVEGKLLLNIESFEKGLYIIQLETNSSITTRRIIIT